MRAFQTALKNLEESLEQAKDSALQVKMPRTTLAETLKEGAETPKEGAETLKEGTEWTCVQDAKTVHSQATADKNLATSMNAFVAIRDPLCASLLTTFVDQIRWRELFQR